MKEKVLVYIFLLFILLPVKVSAQAPFIYPAPDGVITSPYGDRIHPITGNRRFHAGVDIGYDYGTPVQAAADGIIRFYGPADGFGYAAVLWHPQLNMGTLYGDIGLIQGLHEGQQVNQGDVIGVISPVGDSTGGHLHLEVHLNDIDFHVNGAVVTDPIPLLNGTIPTDGSFIDSSFGSDAHFFNFDWAAMCDVAIPLKEIIDKLATQATEGIKNIQDYVLNLFTVVVLIDLSLTFCIASISSRYNGEAILKLFISRLLSYTFYYYLIQNWGSVVINTLKDFFVTVGSKIVDVDVATAGENVTDPTMIIQKGMQLTAPFFSYISTFNTTVGIVDNLVSIVLVFVLGIIIVILFFLIGFMIAKAFVEFYIISIFSIFDVVFGILRQTKHLPFVGNGINALFALGFNIVWYIFFASLVATQLTAANFGDMMTTSDRGAVNLETAGPEAITVFMSAIKDKESTNDYFVYSYDGYGYGAYQISFTNWNAWVEEAGLAADYDWTPHGKMQPAWSPDRQDAVARFKMLQYYQEYGSWRAVAEAWHGGGGNVGSGDSYADDVFRRAGLVAPAPTFDLVKAFQMFLYVAVMCFLGNRVSTYIKNLFGTTGFRFR
ncbi:MULTISPECIES: M23 family metallopeptidase [Megamonas]|jgi:hypothetical protein|uniref:M23 family metallopeptidase n=1 Tax=Megamonas TaxID=158846 RepID=UPI000E417528|nr:MULTISPECIES: M23 family metallopeptidase [Megamonas]RGO06070.1 M23 family peptidase [Megamonas rupellensis]